MARILLSPLHTASPVPPSTPSTPFTGTPVGGRPAPSVSAAPVLPPGTSARQAEAAQLTKELTSVKGQETALLRHLRHVHDSVGLGRLHKLRQSIAELETKLAACTENH